MDGLWGNYLWVLWAHWALVGFVRRFLWGAFVVFVFQISWALEASSWHTAMQSSPALRSSPVPSLLFSEEAFEDKTMSVVPVKSSCIKWDLSDPGCRAASQTSGCWRPLFHKAAHQVFPALGDGGRYRRSGGDGEAPFPGLSSKLPGYFFFFFTITSVSSCHM